MCDKDNFGVLEYCGGYCYNATVEYESKYVFTLQAPFHVMKTEFP